MNIRWLSTGTRVADGAPDWLDSQNRTMGVTGELLKNARTIALQPTKTIVGGVVFFILAVLVVSGTARSQVQSTIAAPSFDASKLAPRLRLLVGAKPEYYQDDKSEAQLIGYLAYPLTRSWTLELQQALVYKDQPEEELLPSDMHLWLKRPGFAKLGQTKFSFLVRAIAGTSEASRENDLRGQLRLYLTSLTTLGKVSIGSTLTYGKYFYEETLASDGSATANHLFAVAPSIAYDINNDVSVSMTSEISTKTNHEYQGNASLAALPQIEGTSYNYLNNLEISYQVSKTLLTAIGVDTAAPLRTEAGDEKPFYLYKTDVSSAYLDIQMKL